MNQPTYPGCKRKRTPLSTLQPGQVVVANKKANRPPPSVDSPSATSSWQLHGPLLSTPTMPAMDSMGFSPSMLAILAETPPCAPSAVAAAAQVGQQQENRRPPHAAADTTTTTSMVAPRPTMLATWETPYAPSAAAAAAVVVAAATAQGQQQENHFNVQDPPSTAATAVPRRGRRKRKSTPTTTTTATIDDTSTTALTVPRRSRRKRKSTSTTTTTATIDATSTTKYVDATPYNLYGPYSGNLTPENTGITTALTVPSRRTTHQFNRQALERNQYETLPPLPCNPQTSQMQMRGFPPLMTGLPPPAAASVIPTTIHQTGSVATPLTKFVSSCKLEADTQVVVQKLKSNGIKDPDTVVSASDVGVDLFPILQLNVGDQINLKKGMRAFGAGMQPTKQGPSQEQESSQDKDKPSEALVAMVKEKGLSTLRLSTLNKLCYYKRWFEKTFPGHKFFEISVLELLELLIPHLESLKGRASHSRSKCSVLVKFKKRQLQDQALDHRVNALYQTYTAALMAEETTALAADDRIKWAVVNYDDVRHATLCTLERYGNKIPFNKLMQLTFITMGLVVGRRTCEILFIAPNGMTFKRHPTGYRAMEGTACYKKIKGIGDYPFRVMDGADPSKRETAVSLAAALLLKWMELLGALVSDGIEYTAKEVYALPPGTELRFNNPAFENKVELLAKMRHVESMEKGKAVKAIMKGFIGDDEDEDWKKSKLLCTSLRRYDDKDPNAKLSLWPTPSFNGLVNQKRFNFDGRRPVADFFARPVTLLPRRYNWESRRRESNSGKTRGPVSLAKYGHSAVDTQTLTIAIFSLETELPKGMNMESHMTILQSHQSKMANARYENHKQYTSRVASNLQQSHISLEQSRHEVANYEVNPVYEDLEVFPFGVRVRTGKLPWEDDRNVLFDLCEPIPKNLSCCGCDKKFAYEWEWREHLKKCQGPGECPMCHKKYKTAALMVQV